MILRTQRLPLFILTLFCCMSVIQGFAQGSIQQTTRSTFPPSIEAPQDKPFPGKIRLELDATDLAHRLYRVKETIPVTDGTKMTLLFPQWTTGDHTPNALASISSKLRTGNLAGESQPSVCCWHATPEENRSIGLMSS